MSHDAEMDAAMARIGVLRYRLDEKEAELTDLKSTADRFKAEVDSLMTNPTSRLLRAEREDYARLKADVQNLNEVISDLRISAEDDLDSIETARIENARLKAEVERLTFDPLTYLDDQGEWMPRHTHLAAVERLKAEVERLEHQVNYWRIEAETDNARWLRCLEDKERLTKAGDAIYQSFDQFGQVDATTLKGWQAAKGGKQS